MVVDNVTATGDVITITSVGNIHEAGGESGADLTALALSLTAATGIFGTSAAEALETDATTLSVANVTSTGAISLSDTAGGLAVTTATTASGDITLNAVGGDLTLSTVTAGGTGRNISLSTTTSGNVVVDNVTATGDVITITSVGNIHEAGGEIRAPT